MVWQETNQVKWFAVADIWCGRSTQQSPDTIQGLHAAALKGCIWYQIYFIERYIVVLSAKIDQYYEAEDEDPF